MESDTAAFEGEEAAIKQAFIREFLDEQGELKVEKTQTAYAVILYMGLYEKSKKSVLIEGLKSQLQEYNGHLSTGFVGTTFLLQALAENGMEKEAYSLLLTEEYPGWNSLADDGTISGDGMNSLNHYAYGSAAGWMYESMCGFRWNETGQMYLKPITDERFSRIKGSYRTVYGKLSLAWSYEAEQLKVEVEVPFQMMVRIILPWGEEHCLESGKYSFIH